MTARSLVAPALCGLLACSGRSAPESPLRGVDPPAAEGSTAPRVSVLGDRIVLSWIEPGAGPALRFATFQGSGWSAARTAATDPLLAIDAANVPGVVPLASGGLAAHWSTNPSADAKHARRLAVATSSDGTTWSPPRFPHDLAIATDRAMATLVPAASGDRFGVTWLDGRAGEMSDYGEGGTALYWADWDGSAFSPEVALDERVCDCCKTSAAATPSGAIVAYRDRGGDERRDISLVMRSASGWSKPAEVRDDGWVLSACPTNGPAIATRGEAAAIGWFTGGQGEKAVRVAVSSDGGRTLGSAVRVDAGDPVGRVETAVLPDGSAAVVWLERRGTAAEVRARRVGPDGAAGEPVVVAATSPSKKSGYPRIAALGPREALVAWIDTTGAQTRVRASTVSLP